MICFVQWRFDALRTTCPHNIAQDICIREHGADCRSEMEMLNGVNEASGITYAFQMRVRVNVESLANAGGDSGGSISPTGNASLRFCSAEKGMIFLRIGIRV